MEILTIKNQLSDTNDFKFKQLKSSFVDQLDVMHKGKRVAIIEGVDGSLLRFITTSEFISIKMGVKLEKMVDKAFKRAIKAE